MSINYKHHKSCLHKHNFHLVQKYPAACAAPGPYVHTYIWRNGNKWKGTLNVLCCALRNENRNERIIQATMNAIYVMELNMHRFFDGYCVYTYIYVIGSEKRALVAQARIVHYGHKYATGSYLG